MWLRDGLGIQMGKCNEDRLTNLPFADDILLIGTSREMMLRLLEDLKDVAGSDFGRLQNRFDGWTLGSAIQLGY